MPKFLNNWVLQHRAPILSIITVVPYSGSKLRQILNRHRKDGDEQHGHKHVWRGLAHIATVGIRLDKWVTRPRPGLIGPSTGTLKNRTCSGYDLKDENWWRDGDKKTMTHQSRLDYAFFFLFSFPTSRVFFFLDYILFQNFLSFKST